MNTDTCGATCAKTSDQEAAHLGAAACAQAIGRARRADIRVENGSAVEGEFWMVWNPKGHAPTYPHDTEDGAITEAERLAKLNRGQQFFVLQAKHARFVDDMHRVTLGSGLPF